MRLEPQLREKNKSPSIEDVDAIPMKRMRAMKEPISIQGRFGFIMLDRGYIKGWRLDNDMGDSKKLDVRIDLPLTVHKVEIEEAHDFDLTFVLDQDTTHTISVEGTLMHEIKDTKEDERYLVLRLSFNDAASFKEICDFFNQQSYSPEMSSSFGPAVGQIKRFATQALTTSVGLILATAVVVATKTKMPTDDQEEQFCKAVATASPDNPNMIPRSSAANLTPEKIVKECQRRFKIAVPVENARAAVREGKDKKSK